MPNQRSIRYVTIRASRKYCGGLDSLNADHRIALKDQISLLGIESPSRLP